ncbi:PREDICTED: uncharacterized protein LOC109470692 [Branchiostoma belcheri]|uniref:Uncharacterized protein LOC109470692 n=1 Tax=Branchiostoma belcheri TaxID=7741 RepID=A0A6P4YU42_BRABE|nr:PREDICTED: uncharacterized protein LOC109470692 [Branchiostoma belcheri]
MESSTKDQSDNLRGVIDTCGICCEKLCLYKTLSCQHRFCVICLEKYVKARDEIVCPVCSETIPLPDGGVEGLPSYYFIDLDKDSCGKDQKKRFAASKLKWDESCFSCDHLSGGDVKGSPTEDNNALERRRLELHRMLLDFSASSRRGRGRVCVACQKLMDGFRTGKQAIVGGVKDRVVRARKAIQSTKIPKVLTWHSPTLREENVPERIKILLLGDSGSGKSYLLNKYVDRSDDDPGPTLGLDFRTKDLTVDGRQVKLQLWDTSGHARFRSLISRYFRQADAVVLVYDTSHPGSFQSIQTWREIFLKHAPANQSEGSVDIIHIKEAHSVENSSFKLLASLQMSAQESSKTVKSFVDNIMMNVKGAAERAGQGLRSLARKGETSEDSDVETSGYVSDAENAAGVTFMVLGNNRSTDDSKDSYSDAEAWCRSNKIRYHVTSSQNATELDMAFLGLVNDVIAGREHAP